MAEDIRQALSSAFIQPTAATGGFLADPALSEIAGQLAPRSRRVYRHDAEVFGTWLLAQGLQPHMLEKVHMVAYRAYLQDHYAKSTAARMLSVARRLLAEQVERKQLERNPAETVRGFTGADETTHVVLTPEQAQVLLDAPDLQTLLGLRDYVLMLFLLRTGVRRSEAAGLIIADLTMRQGHHVAIIRHGKGDQRRIVKVPVDVWRDIQSYLDAFRQYHARRLAQQLQALEEERAQMSGEDYQACAQKANDQHTMQDTDNLFVWIRRGDHATRHPLSDRSIATIVEKYAAQAHIEALSPHGLRASFITLTLESGASLHQVQYAAGHRDPRTTERYQKRKMNLDRNAVDAIHFTRSQHTS